LQIVKIIEFQKFNSEGEHISNIGNQGNLGTPVDLDIDDLGNIYVADNLNRRSKFLIMGVYL
jgi:hypothetical protein